MGKMLVAQTANIVYLWTVICLRRHNLLYRLNLYSSNQKQCVVVIIYCIQLFKGTYLCIACFIYTSCWLRMWSLVLIALDEHILIHAYKYNCTNQQPTANCRRTGWRLYNPPKFRLRVYNNNDVVQIANNELNSMNTYLIYILINNVLLEKNIINIFSP